MSYRQEDMKVLIRVASSANVIEDPSLLDSLLDSEGWQTVMAFTRESARKYWLLTYCDDDV